MLQENEFWQASKFSTTKYEKNIARETHLWARIVQENKENDWVWRYLLNEYTQAPDL